MKICETQLMVNKLMGVDEETFNKFSPRADSAVPQMPVVQEYIDAQRRVRKLLGLPE